MKFVRPRCYFDVELSDIPLGRIVFELYSDICPITCENFRALCTGEKGIGKTTGKNLHYLNIVFHRVVKGFMIQSGDFSVGNGTGGESIYGGTFEDENFELIHDEPFLLSMANRGKDTNGSQFFITTQPAPHLDGIHVVFGHVVSGQNVVSHIENLPVDKVSRPLQDVRVVKCNELVLKSKLKVKEKKKATTAPSGSSGGDSESEGEEEGREKEEGEQSGDSGREGGKKRKKNKKEKKRKKKKKKSRKHAGSDSEGEEGGSEEGEKRGGGAKGSINPITGTVTKILDPAEIPDVPTNSFLFRGGGREKGGGGGGREEERGERRRGEERKWRRENIRGYTKSGRVIKGRGVFRYRTPSRSRSRSFTPPHWKQAETRTIKLSEFQKLEQEKQEKEEEIKKREEARRRRHEEREKEAKNKKEEKKKKKKREKDEEEEEEEEGAAEKPKPPRSRRSNADSDMVALVPRHGREDKPAEDTGPVDYNALDYDDDGTSELDSAEEPPASREEKLVVVKEKEKVDRDHQILVVNSQPDPGRSSSQITANMLATLQGMHPNGKEEKGSKRRSEKGRKQGSGQEKEKESSATDDEDSEDDKENDKGRSGKRPPAALDHSPSPATQRRALEALLRAKLLEKRAALDHKSKSRSLSRENPRRRRRTLSKTTESRKSGDGKPSEKSGDGGRQASKPDEKHVDDARSVITGRRDKEAKKQREEKAQRDAAATPEELFPDKDTVVSQVVATQVPRKSRPPSPGGEKKAEAIGGNDQKANGSNASRDKFKTTRKRSHQSRSTSRDDRSSRKRKRSRTRDERSRSRDHKRRRSRDRRDRDRSPRGGRDGKRTKRDRSSSSSERSRDRNDRSRERKRSRDRRRRHDRSRSRGKRSDSEKPRRGNRGRDSPLKEQERSEEAKRKLTARLKEREKEREGRDKGRGRDRDRKSRRRRSSSSSSSDTSTDSDSSRR